jgi:hypothetical protein
MASKLPIRPATGRRFGRIIVECIVTFGVTSFKKLSFTTHF